jgi:hypothetical protein
MKRILITFLLTSTISFSQILKLGEVNGVFMSVGIGPKFPIAQFSKEQNIGIGFDVGLSYVDNKILPVFFSFKAGFHHHPGSQDLYKTTDLASLSSNVIVMNFGIRYYFPPIIDQFLIVMPVLDGNFLFSYWEKAYQFKRDSNRNNYVEEIAKAGFQLGGGVSMFLLDVLAFYNYLPDNQFISIDFRIRIPIFVKY